MADRNPLLAVRRYACCLPFLLGLAAIGISVPAHAQTAVTLAQLQQFLANSQKNGSADSDIAMRLNSVSLSERLSNAQFSHLLTVFAPGRQTAEQLEILADESLLADLPSTENSNQQAPDPTAQQQMIASATKYASYYLQHLPDFLATRVTRAFDNSPQLSEQKHSKPKILMHLASVYKEQITYRDGQETILSGAAYSSHPSRHSLTSRGEFGPALVTVLHDITSGSIVWSYWEQPEKDTRLAVFRYSVPEHASHYMVDFCCYSKSENEPEAHLFHQYAAYHGEISLDPETGIVYRLTMQTDLDNPAPVAASTTAIEYGEVTIGGRAYFCPLRSVTTIAVHSPEILYFDGIGLAKYLNEASFVNYHKFGSTSQILTNQP